LLEPTSNPCPGLQLPARLLEIRSALGALPGGRATLLACACVPFAWTLAESAAAANWLREGTIDNEGLAHVMSLRSGLRSLGALAAWLVLLKVSSSALQKWTAPLLLVPALSGAVVYLAFPDSGIALYADAALAGIVSGVLGAVLFFSALDVFGESPFYLSLYTLSWTLHSLVSFAVSAVPLPSNPLTLVGAAGVSSLLAVGLQLWSASRVPLSPAPPSPSQ
jgi:hypothetical protein